MRAAGVRRGGAGVACGAGNLRELLRRQVGDRWRKRYGLDPVLQELQRQVGSDPDCGHEAERDAAWVLQRADLAGAGCAGGVHPPGADLHAGGDWEVGFLGGRALGVLRGS